MKLKISTSRAIVVLWLSVGFIGKINTVRVAWFYPYLCCLPLFGFLLYLSKESRGFGEIGNCIIKMAVIPYAAGFIYSFLSLNYFIGIMNSAMRAINLSLQFVYIITFASTLFAKFREETIDVIGDAMILSYMYTLVIALHEIGIKGFGEYFTTVALYGTSINEYFEMHDIGLSMGFILIYYLLIKKEKSFIRIIISFLAFFFCYKRIAFLAVIVTILIWIILKKRESVLRNFQINIILIGILICCFLYVALISTGLLYTIGAKYGFSFGNRSYLFGFMRPFYEWSLLFKGYGMGFTEKYMSSFIGTQTGYGIRNMGSVHNDILKMFIDLGFMGSFLWFFWYTWVFPKKIASRFGDDAKFYYCLSMIYAYIVYTTDNAMRYFIFQLVLYSLVLYGCYKSKKEKADRGTKI